MAFQSLSRGLGALVLCGLLGACASPLPSPSANQAFVMLESSGPVDDVLAEKVDGQRVTDARYFEVRPGEHDLKVLIEQQGLASADQACTGDIRYPDFKAGHRYTLEETSHGPYVDARLRNAQGRTVAQATNLDCMPD